MAARELGLSSSLTLIDDKTAPLGCFFVEQEGRLYHNTIGTASSRYDFAKSLCRYNNASGSLLRVTDKTIAACGILHNLTVYTVAAEHLEQALEELRVAKRMQFALRLGVGMAALTKPLAFGDGHVVVLAGVQAQAAGAALDTVIDLGLKNAAVFGSASVCMQDLRLQNGRQASRVTKNRNAAEYNLVNRMCAACVLLYPHVFCMHAAAAAAAAATAAAMAAAATALSYVCLCTRVCVRAGAQFNLWAHVLQ